MSPTANSKKAKSLIAWSAQGTSSVREYIETVVVIGAITAVGWLLAPNTSHLAIGLVYLLAVIVLSLRVGRRPVLFAGVLSALTWDYLIIPPHFSFAIQNFDDGMMLGTYCVVALVAGQLTARVRAQELVERLREQRATALFHLTRALAATNTLQEAATAFLRQADAVFNARTALLLTGEDDTLLVHSTSSFSLKASEFDIAIWARKHRREAGRFTTAFPFAEGFHLPLLQNDVCHGVFVLCPETEARSITPVQRELIGDFGTQITLIIERERLRTAIERERTLARSEELHRVLLDSVSHELKTPLAVLSTAVEKMNSKTEGERAAMLGEIRIATKRLTRLVNNLLNQSRLESGVLHPRLDWCNVRDVFNAALQELNNTLSSKKNITIDVPTGMPLLMADAPLLEQIVFNLLLNAVSHTPEGTEVVLSAGIAGGKSPRAYMTVADRGPGLPVELRENPFQKFQRPKPAGAGGLGLGLSVVRGFAVAQGGQVEAGDNPGGGAVFTVYLPHVLHGSVPNE